MNEQTKDLEPKIAADECHPHEWVVFSTALREGWLMLQCVECGAMATVENPTTEEWGEAFHAPSAPYRWLDDSRITLRPSRPGVIYVVRAEPRPSCDCVCCGDIQRKYDRFPAEIVSRRELISDDARDEILELAEFVDDHGDMCGHLLPCFVERLSIDTDMQVHRPTLEIVERIRLCDSKGLHMAAPVVARVLRVFAHGRID